MQAQLDLQRSAPQRDPNRYRVQRPTTTDRAIRNDVASLDDLEYCELLIGRPDAGDCTRWAMILLRQFGSAAGVLQADFQTLLTTVPRDVAVRIRVAHDAARRLAQPTLSKAA